MILPRHHHRVAHPIQFAQAALDLAQLDAQAADLDLEVGPPEELNLPADPPAGPVASAIQTSSHLWLVAGRLADRGGRGHEELGGQAWTGEVAASHLHATDVELAGNAHGGGPKGAIQDLDAGVPQRSPDRHQRPLALLGAGPPGHFHRRLGRSVEVVEFAVGKTSGKAAHQVHGKRLAAGEDAQDRATTGRVWLFQEGAEHRRDKVQQSDGLALDEAR